MAHRRMSAEARVAKADTACLDAPSKKHSGTPEGVEPRRRQDMSTQNYFRSPSGHVLKVVIGNDGRAVAKNYEAKQLHPGDIGLHLRIDRYDPKMMTEAQLHVARELAESMTADFLSQLGQENSTEFKRGTLVLLVSEQKYFEIGLVEKDSGEILYLTQFDAGGHQIRTRKSVTNYDVRELRCPYTGLKALIYMSVWFKDHNRRPDSPYTALNGGKASLQLLPAYDPNFIPLVTDDEEFLIRLFYLLEERWFDDLSQETASRILRLIPSETKLKALLWRWRKWDRVSPDISKHTFMDDCYRSGLERLLKRKHKKFLMELVEFADYPVYPLSAEFVIMVMQYVDPDWLKDVVRRGNISEKYANISHRCFYREHADKIARYFEKLGDSAFLDEMANMDNKEFSSAAKYVKQYPAK